MKRLKHIAVIVFLSVLAGCSGQTGKNPGSSADTVKHAPIDSAGLEAEPVASDSVHLTAADSALIAIAENILRTIKANDFKKLSTFVHPRLGLRFSPYAYVDTTDDSRLSVRQLADPATLARKVTWGSFEAGKDADNLSIREYFARFVYDKDFLHAEKKSVNRFYSQGTDLNNITEAFPGTNIVEFHFPGFDPQYGGLDFRSLRLVFKTENKKTYLTGIVHDEWTP